MLPSYVIIETDHPRIEVVDGVLVMLGARHIRGWCWCQPRLTPHSDHFDEGHKIYADGGNAHNDGGSDG